jgi:FtsZ-binding cell division protein ZapB
MGPPLAKIVSNPDVQIEAEVEAEARDLEIERDKPIALARVDALAAENKQLKKQNGFLTRRINSLLEENSSLKDRETMWRDRALAAGWHADA